MRPPKPRRRRLVGIGLLAVTAGLGVLLASLASAAADTKPFTVTVSVAPDANLSDARPDAWVGAIPTITISIRNDANPQTLGSANITVPAGIVPDPPLPGGNVIELRNLNLAPGATVSVSLTARIPCVPDATGYPWVVQVKQSNDFNGTGNDFTPTGDPPRLFGFGVCSLAFQADGEPASAQRGTNITADAYSPGDGSRPVAVRVVDGSGVGTVTWWSTPVALAIAPGFNTGGGTFSGTTSASPVLGVARFPVGGAGPQIDRSAGGYRLTASSDGVTGAAPISTPFDIVDVGQRCKGSTCSGSTSNTRFAAAVTASGTTTDDVLILSLGAPDAPAVDCAGYAETSDTLAFNVITLTGGPNQATKTILYTINNPVKSAPQYDVCFRSPAAFTAKSLTPAPLQLDGSYLALLPDCRRVGDIPPCVADRARVGGTVVLTINAPVGDPWLRG